MPMSRTCFPRVLFVFGLFGLITGLAVASGPDGDAKRDAKPTDLELTGYRTVKTAATTFVKPFAAARTEGFAGYLGVSVTLVEGKLTVAAVATDSPAARAGVKKDDVLLKAADKAVATSEQ